MSKPPRKSPGVGRNAIGGNSGLASHDVINKALAVEVLDKEEIAKLVELRKKHRKRSEGDGVVLADLDDLYKSKDDPISEVVQMIKRKIHYLGAVFMPLRAQVDMFVKASESPEMQHAAYHSGRMQALKGGAADPPPNVVGEDLQLWQEGFSDGAKARAEAQKERKVELQDILAEALKNADEGKVTDGTGKNGPGAPAVVDAKTKAKSGRNAQAEKVGEQAATDFGHDNPDVPRLGDDVAPPQPDWTGFSDDPEAWDESQAKAFHRWYALVPAAANPEIGHAGVAEAFAGEREAAADAEPVKDDPALDGDGTPPEPTAGPAPADTVYMMADGEPFASGRQATYRNGKEFGTQIPGKIEVYDEHPFEASQEELEAQKPRQASAEIKAAAEAGGVDPEDAARLEAHVADAGTAAATTVPSRNRRRLPGEKSE